MDRASADFAPRSRGPGHPPKSEVFEGSKKTLPPFIRAQKDVHSNLRLTLTIGREGERFFAELVGRSSPVTPSAALQPKALKIASGRVKNAEAVASGGTSWE